MFGYFVWAVKGEYSRRSLDDSSKTTTVAFDCLVLTRDPIGRHVAQLALEMRIGEPEHWDAYNPVISEMRALGWAQGAVDEQP